MGNFIKTFIACLIAAILAGGVVYYATPIEHAADYGVLRTSTPPSQRPQTPEQRGGVIDRFIKPLNDAVRARQEAVRRERPGETSQPPSQSNTSPNSSVKYFQLENGELTEIDTLPAPSKAQDAENPNAALRIFAVMEQTELMTQPDLKDRAYLGIVDFALSEDLFTSASTAMEKIAQVELRDTARSRIAIALADKGDSDAAFAQIDAVEVDELRDIMRLQVIEALIMPPPPPQNGQ